jgi:hypothetical protein
VSAYREDSGPYPVGSFFLTRISGRTGWWVGIMQAIAGIPSRWTHAGIIGSGGRTYEAGPGGVYIGSLADLKGKPHVVSDAVVRRQLADADILDRIAAQHFERVTRCDAADEAHNHLGIGYSFLDYLALALLHLEVLLTGRPSGQTKWWITRRIRQRVQDSGHMICSAFVDHWASHLGFEFFDDDRLPGDVTPSDLDAWLDDHGRAA